MFESSIRKMTFSMNHFGQIFSLAVISSKFLNGIKKKAPKHQTV